MAPFCAPAPASLQGPGSSLAAVLGSDMALGMGLGPTTALALRPASKEVGAAAAAILSAVLARCPGALCVCGGTNGEKELRSAERFDPTTGAWEPLPPMLQARAGATAAAVRGMLYVCGGHDGEEHLSSAERFDPARGCWEALPEMPRRRVAGTAAALNGVLVVCGGFDGHRDLAAAECWDPEARTWRVLPDMLQPRHAAAAAAVCGRLYVCGGGSSRGGRGAPALRSAEAFGFAAGAWRPVKAMQEGRRWAAAAGVQGRVHVCGGEGGDELQIHGRRERQPLKTAERFDPILDEWEPLPCMPTGVARAASAGVGGFILICGGSGTPAADSRADAASAHARRLDPVAGPWSRWEVLPQALEPRLLAAAASLLA